MLVVIEVPDDMSPESIAFELGLLAEDNARIVEDDPEDLDGGLSLRTENCQLGVSRIVGSLRQVNAPTPGDRFVIEPMES